MTDFETALVVLVGCLQGIGIGYVIWAPLTPFKQGLVDGLAFKWLRRKNV